MADELAYVMRRAAEGDRRFRRKTPGELERVAELRWSLSPLARHLADEEQEHTRRAQAYLTFARVHPYRFGKSDQR